MDHLNGDEGHSEQLQEFCGQLAAEQKKLSSNLFREYRRQLKTPGNYEELVRGTVLCI